MSPTSWVSGREATYEPMVHGLLRGEGGWGAIEDVGNGLLRSRSVGDKVLEKGVDFGNVHLPVGHGPEFRSCVDLGASKRRVSFVDSAKFGWGAGCIRGYVRHNDEYGDV